MIIAGRGFGPHSKGQKLTSKNTHTLKAGTVLLMESHHNGELLARNAIRVTKVNATDPRLPLFWANYLYPPSEKDTFSIWAFELRTRSFFFTEIDRPLKQTAEPQTLFSGN